MGPTQSSVIMKGVHNEIWSPETAVFLTCCDNKKQQTGVELHFQSWDISVSETLLIPDPYRFFQIYSACAIWWATRAKCEKWSPVFLRTVPTRQRGVRNFPSPSFPPNGNRCAVRGRSAAQSPKLDTRVSGSLSCNVGWTERRRGRGFFFLHRLQAVPCGRLNQSAFPKMRGRNPVVAAGAGFYTVYKRCTGNPLTTGGMRTWEDGGRSLALLHLHPTVCQTGCDGNWYPEQDRLVCVLLQYHSVAVICQNKIKELDSSFLATWIKQNYS